MPEKLARFNDLRITCTLASNNYPGSIDMVTVHLPAKTYLRSIELIRVAEEIIKPGLGDHLLLASVVREPLGRIQIAELLYRVSSEEPRVVCIKSRILSQS